MRLPRLPYTAGGRAQEIVAFRGLNRTENTREGELQNAVNMSTKDFPCLTQRGKREAAGEHERATDLYEWDGHLLVVDNGVLYYDDEPLANVSDEKKQWAVVNTKLIVWPDALLVDLTNRTVKPLANTQTNAGAGSFGSNVIHMQNGRYGGTGSNVTGTGVSYYTYANKPVYSNGAFDVSAAVGGSSQEAGRWFIPVVTVSEETGARTFSNPPSSSQPIGNEEGWVGYVKSSFEGREGNYRWYRPRVQRFWEFEYFNLASGTLSESFKEGDLIVIEGTRFGFNDGENTVTAVDDAAQTITCAENFKSQPSYYYYCASALSAGRYVLRGDSYYFSSGISAGTALLVYNGRVEAWDPEKKRVVAEYTASGSGGTTLSTERWNDDVPFSVKKKLPPMDFICEKDNRLWGVSNAQKNEIVSDGGTATFTSRAIYASALGDPTAWYTFDGLDTDSYQVAVGSEGDFTGICSFDGAVCCWKEHRLHKVFGSYPSEYYMHDYKIEGVAAGSSRSMTIVNETLYYNGATGVYAYSGGVPTLIGYELGETLTDAAGGTDGNRWYLSGVRENDETEVLVYDLTHRTWMREDDAYAEAFALVGGALYALVNGEVVRMERGDDEALEWSAELVTFTETETRHKYYQRVVLRLDMSAGSSVTVQVREDKGEWRTVLDADAEANVLKNVSLPVRRCDRFDVRVSGVGKVLIRDLTREFIMGSERR